MKKLLYTIILGCLIAFFMTSPLYGVTYYACIAGNISAANAWEELGGDTEFNTHFSIDAEDKVEDAVEGEDGEIITTSYFKLTFVEKVEKQVRKRKDGSIMGDDEEDEEESIDAVASDPFEAM